MKTLTAQRPMRERILSLFMAVLMIFGLIPIMGLPSHAAGLTMTNHYVNRSLDSGGNYIGKYNSPNLTGGSNVSLRGIPVTLSDGSKSWAFCNDHGKSLTSGMTYTQDTTYTIPEALKPFLNFFYFYTLVAGRSTTKALQQATSTPSSGLTERASLQTTMTRRK